MKLNFKFSVFTALLISVVLFASCGDEKNLDKNPVADFTTKIEGFKVQFINLSENGESYQWTFGDENESTKKDPEHVYASAGKFNVTLKVTNASGTNELTKEVVIEELFQGDRILIDGKFDDWANITAFKPKEDATYQELEEIKLCSNQNYIFVYGKANKDIFPTSYLSVFFDYDLSSATGYLPWYAEAGFETMAQLSVEGKDGPLFLYTGEPGVANWLWDEIVASGTGFCLWGEPKEGDASYEFEFYLDKSKIVGLGKKTVGISFYFEESWLTQGLIPSAGAPLVLNLETGIAAIQ